jgi:hypothetical protein
MHQAGDGIERAESLANFLESVAKVEGNTVHDEHLDLVSKNSHIQRVRLSVE